MTNPQHDSRPAPPTDPRDVKAWLEYIAAPDSDDDGVARANEALAAGVHPARLLIPTRSTEAHR